MADRIFLREVRLSNKQSLLFYQSSVGNVSCVVWDAALVLTKYLDKRTRSNLLWLRKLKTVELGAGLGCVGIAAACYGAHVILTDLPDVVPQLVKTVELNKTKWSERHGQVTSLPLKWGQSVGEILKCLGQSPDLILLSDCVYYEEGVDALFDTLLTLCTPRHTEVIICQEKRDSPKHQEVWKYFFNKLQENFFVKKVPIEEQDEVYSSPDIFLFIAYKKAHVVLTDLLDVVPQLEIGIQHVKPK